MVFTDHILKKMRILLVQTSWLGDTILSTPVISGIKIIHPDAELWMMTTPLASALIERDPLLAGVLTYDKRNKDSGLSGFFRMLGRIRQLKFDVVYSLHKSYRTALLLRLCGIPLRIGFSDAKLRFLYQQTYRRNPGDHDVVRNLSLLSGEISQEAQDKELRLFPPEDSAVNQAVHSVLSPIERYAVLVPGSAWETKMWPWQGYREVAKYLMKKGLQVILLGDQSEKPVNEKVAKLELEKTELLAELENIREKAETKANSLEEEVTKLREETVSLKKLLDTL